MPEIYLTRTSLMQSYGCEDDQGIKKAQTGIQ